MHHVLLLGPAASTVTLFSFFVPLRKNENKGDMTISYRDTDSRSPDESGCFLLASLRLYCL